MPIAIPISVSVAVTVTITRVAVRLRHPCHQRACCRDHWALGGRRRRPGLGRRPHRLAGQGVAGSAGALAEKRWPAISMLLGHGGAAPVDRSLVEFIRAGRANRPGRRGAPPASAAVGWARVGWAPAGCKHGAALPRQTAVGRCSPGPVSSGSGSMLGSAAPARPASWGPS